jgi:predicted phage terminase large subunit-like protein
MAKVKITPELVAKMTPDARATIKRKCQTDLYFLAKDVYGIPLYEPVHSQMVDLFVQKNPDTPFHEQSPAKQRLLLAPRNTMKTTMDECDIAQWFLCFPGIRILLLTGTQDLGERMVAKVKRWLQHEVIRALFPELGIPPADEKWGTSGEFTIPERGTTWKEPSLSSSTIASAKASGHFEVFKFDDCVNEVNSKTVEQRQKIIDSFDESKYLCEPDYYVDVIGTRWDMADLYGQLIKRNEDAVAEGEEPETNVLALAAWKLIEGRELQKNANGIPVIKADDVELLYPDRIKFRELSKQYRANPYSFSCQQLNSPDPNIEQQVKSFPLDMLLRHKLPYDGMPYSGKKYICWDLSGYTKTAKSDWTVGIVGMVDDKNRLFIVDIIRGKYNPVQQAAAIVEAAKKWNPETTIIEPAQGARALEPTIVRTAQEVGTTVPILWWTPTRDKDAKINRIGYLATVLRAEQLWFANYANNLDYLFDELTQYPYARHDDHSDALAILVMNLGLNGTTARVQPTAEDKEIVRQRIFEQMMFGDSRPSSVTPKTESSVELFGSSLILR